MNFFVANGVRLAYTVDGPEDAPTIVMINSLGTDLRMWNPQVALLGERMRIVRYDCRGHGASEVPDGPYSIEQFGQDLLVLFDTLSIQRAHICGLSLGGVIALWLAINHPERVQRAIFANTAARIGTDETWKARIDAVRKGGMAAIKDTVLARFLSADFREHYPETAHQIGEMIAATNPAGYVGACIALRDSDLSEQVSTIRVPSLILAGELDESTPMEQGRELHEAIADSEFAVFRKTAHLSNIEHPEQFSRHVLQFLQVGS
jgi:3-oxoadipate enol-lactonase